MQFQGIVLGLITILIWGVTFVNTKVLLNDFNSFEILFLWFAVAYAALWAIKPRRFSVGGWRQELHFAARGLSGVASYQFLENCAINYTNASNVAILVSALAFVLWNRTCALLGTVRATCGIYFIPAVTAVVAYFALGESLTAMTGLGALLTIFGVVICG